MSREFICCANFLPDAFSAARPGLEERWWDWFCNPADFIRSNVISRNRRVMAQWFSKAAQTDRRLLYPAVIWLRRMGRILTVIFCRMRPNWWLELIPPRQTR